MDIVLTCKITFEMLILSVCFQNSCEAESLVTVATDKLGYDSITFLFTL